MKSATHDVLFVCQCYGPGLPPEGRRAQAQAHGEELAITIEGRLIRLPWKTCQIDATGFDQQSLVLTWRGDGGQWIVKLVDPGAFVALVSNAPELLREKLDRWQQGVTRSRRRFGPSAIITGLGVVLLVTLVVLWLLSRGSAAPSP